MKFLIATALAFVALVATPTSAYPVVAYEVHYTASTTTVECLPAGSHTSDNPLITSMRRLPREDWSCAAGADDTREKGTS